MLGPNLFECAFRQFLRHGQIKRSAKETVNASTPLACHLLKLRSQQQYSDEATSCPCRLIVELLDRAGDNLNKICGILKRFELEVVSLGIFGHKADVAPLVLVLLDRWVDPADLLKA